MYFGKVGDVFVVQFYEQFGYVDVLIVQLVMMQFVIGYDDLWFVFQYVGYVVGLQDYLIDCFVEQYYQQDCQYGWDQWYIGIKQ